MQKIRDFVFFFIWITTCEVIGADLGIIHERTNWDKYIIALIGGLLNAFYLAPLQRKRKAQMKMENSQK